MNSPLGGGVGRSVLVERKEGNIHTICRADIFGVLLCVIGYPRPYEGMFLVPNWERAKKKALANPDTANRKPEWSIVPSVYAAYRQTLHILHQYGATLHEGEKQLLITTRETALNLNLRALGKGGRTPIPKVHESLRNLVVQIVDPLQYVRNVHKRDARQQMLAILSVDGEPINRPAVRARAVATRNDLFSRVDEVMRIEPRILGRQQVLLSLIHLAELFLEVTNDFLDKLLHFDGFMPLFDYTRRKIVADHLEFLAQELEQLDFNPYREMCVLTARDMRDARDTLRKERLKREDWQRFRLLLKCCHTAITIKNIQIEIERSILHLLKYEHGGGTFPSDTLLAKVLLISQQLRTCDDSMLEKPVCSTSLAYLDEAKLLLLNQPHLESLKKRMRQASAAL